MDEQALLSAISAAPDDNTPRLIYADWLEERGDPRAELVRLQVRLRDAPPDDPARPQLQSRVQTLRVGCSAYWLARLDPPVWCAAGNIVDARPNTPEAESRLGTRLFRPNTKIYLATLKHIYALLDPKLYNLDSIEIIGQHRQSRQWIGSWIKPALTTHWRVQLVHQPGVLVRLRESGWPGFRLRPNEFHRPEGESGDPLRALCEAIFAAMRRPS